LQRCASVFDIALQCLHTRLGTKTEYIVYIAKNPVDLTSTSSKTLKIKSPMKKIADGGLGGVAVLFNNSKLQTIDGTPNLIFE